MAVAAPAPAVSPPRLPPGDYLSDRSLTGLAVIVHGTPYTATGLVMFKRQGKAYGNTYGWHHHCKRGQVYWQCRYKGIATWVPVEQVKLIGGAL